MTSQPVEQRIASKEWFDISSDYHAIYEDGTESEQPADVEHNAALAREAKLREALRLLWDETKLAGNDKATDFGWPKVREKVLAALEQEESK